MPDPGARAAGPGTWARALSFWVFAAFWTLLVLGTATVLSLLTLGRLRHSILGLAGPAWARPCLAVAGVRLRVVGLEHLHPPEARVLVMNHQSVLEIFAIAALGLPRHTYLGKREFRWIPVLGQAWWALGGHFVDRGNRTSALNSMGSLARDMKRNQLTAVVAPEGTRSRTGELQRFKLGAFHLAVDVGVPMVPLVFHNSGELAPPDGLKLTPGVLEVEIMPPVDTGHWRRDDLRRRAEELNQAYRGWLLKGPPPHP